MNKNKKILIVEDELPLSTVLSEKLTLSGFFVTQAKNGVEGLDMALKNHPDLILLDIIMPKMDGMEMLSKLRADEWGKDVPVIILTNLSEAGKVADAVVHGVHDYVVKADWTLDDVIKKINLKLNI